MRVKTMTPYKLVVQDRIKQNGTVDRHALSSPSFLWKIFTMPVQYFTHGWFKNRNVNKFQWIIQDFITQKFLFTSLSMLWISTNVCGAQSR